MSLIDVDLLYRLSWRIRLTSPDRMVKDYDFLHAHLGLFQERLDFLVVAIAYCGVVFKELLFGWLVEHGESAVVGCEVLLLATEVGDCAIVVTLLEGFAWAVYLE